MLVVEAQIKPGGGEEYKAALFAEMIRHHPATASVEVRDA